MFKRRTCLESGSGSEYQWHMRATTLQSAGDVFLETRSDVVKRGHKAGKVSSGMCVYYGEFG
jgi:hypothetical protein